MNGSDAKNSGGILELADDPEFVLMRGEFLAQLPERARSIRQAARREDFAEVIQLAHNLRGSAALFGHPEVGEISGLIENLARGRTGGAALDEHAERLVSAVDLAVRITTGLRSD